jgi:hypothetical protein
MAPNMANPISRATMPAVTKTWFLSSLSGRTGSMARRSASTKAPSATTVRTPRPITWAEAHG